MKKILVVLFGIVFSCGTLLAQVAEEQPRQTMIQKVEGWYEDNMNYATITTLMAVESSFIPFPSEIVIPPAAYIASKPDSKLNIFLVVIFGTLGALVGALINYVLSLSLGRLIIYKFADSRLGKLCLLSSEKIQKAEDYFNEHGKISTFIGRLIPAIRQLISIPAGLAKMNIASFCIYTCLGAIIWNSVLALLGYLAQGQQDLIYRYSHELSIAILALLGLAIAYFVWKKWRKRNDYSKVRYSLDGKVLVRCPEYWEGEFVIPEGVTEIGKEAFEGCTSLASIAIPNSVKEIGECAFGGCTSLTELHICVEKLESLCVESSAFEKCDLENCILFVPVGTGYAYRHHPLFSKFKEVIER